MKKLVALLLCLSILVPMAAMADETFKLLFAVLSDDDILGKPTFAGELDSEGSKTCLLTVDLSTSTVMLFADNSNGKVDAALWNDVDPTNLLAILAYYAENFKETDDMDPDAFVIGIKLEENSETLFITNEKEAKMLSDIIKNN